MARTTLARRSLAGDSGRFVTLAACASLVALLLALLLSLAGPLRAEPGHRGPLFAPQRWSETGGATAATSSRPIEVRG
jgi:hypothetical protein